jgi:hypothetical protein
MFGAFDRKGSAVGTLPGLDRELRVLYIARGKNDYTLVKIGYSKRQGIEGLSELERHCGRPLKFIARAHCNYAWDLEQRLHQVVRKFAKESAIGSEWYKVPVLAHPSLVLLLEEISEQMKDEKAGFECRIEVLDENVTRRMIQARTKLNQLKLENLGNLHYFHISQSNQS